MGKEFHHGDAALHEPGFVVPLEISGEIDISLLEESLRMTPLQRMRANDDALNFADSLQAAMERRRAKPD